jgi:hypothetical protein
MEIKNEQKSIGIYEALQAAIRLRTKLKKELRTVEKEIFAYRKALHLAQGRLIADASASMAQSMSYLRGMSRPEACKILMEEMGGKASITELVPKLMAAGLITTDTEKAWNKVRTALEQRLDLFTKVGQGQYALVECLKEELPPEMPSINGRPPKPIKDKAFGILEREGKPLHYQVILEKLQEEGVTVQGRNPLNTLRAHLSQDSRFKNMGRGIWGLGIHHKEPISINNESQKIPFGLNV